METRLGTRLCEFESIHIGMFVYWFRLRVHCTQSKNRAGKCRLPIRRSPSKLCASLDSSRGLRMDEPKLSISPHPISQCRLGKASGAGAASPAVDVRRLGDPDDGLAVITRD